MSHNVNRPQRLIGSFYFYLNPLSIVYVPKTAEFEGQVTDEVMINHFSFQEFLRRAQIPHHMFLDIFRDSDSYILSGILTSDRLYHLGIELEPGVMPAMIITYLHNH